MTSGVMTDDGLYRPAAWQAEITEGKRYRFGANWRNFLRGVSEAHIPAAQDALTRCLRVNDLRDASFLDIGSGSGLFSLAARRLGASVTSFDYDPDSVKCTVQLRDRYYPSDPGWRIKGGSVLDHDFMSRLGQYDYVYSFGVLMMTGHLWDALENSMLPVKPGGKLYVAIYNDQGSKSQAWRVIKRFYISGAPGRVLVCAAFMPYWIGRGLVADLVRLRNPVGRYRRSSDPRAMWLLTDWFDWLGGYPFEVAKPEEVFEFAATRGFKLEWLRTRGGGMGNNEFVFVRE